MRIDYVAGTVALASFDFLWLSADDSHEISEQAAKLNQRELNYLHRKQYDQAIANFHEALQIQPEYADTIDNLGKALEAADKGGEAIAQFDKAISIAPEKAAAYADKGQTLFHAGKYEEAAASYRPAIEHHVNFSERRMGWGRRSCASAKVTKQSRPSAPPSPATPVMSLRWGISVPPC